MGLYGSYTVAEDVMSVVDSVTKQDVLKVFVFLFILFIYYSCLCNCMVSLL